MRYTKILVAVTLALSALLLSLLVLSQARADAPGPDIVQQQLDSPPSDPVAIRLHYKLDMWLMPDFERDGVWVAGEFEENARPPLPLKEEWIYRSGRSICFLGWWEGSWIEPISHTVKGAYALHLPGFDLSSPDLQPTESVIPVVRIRLASGIVLSDTVLPQPGTPVSPTAPTTALTGTMGVTLTFTPTATLVSTPTTVLTASYAFTGLEISPATGQFAVSPTITLIADYALPERSAPPATETVTWTTLSMLTSTLRTYGDYTRIDLVGFSEFVTQPITLTVPFYPFEKAIDLTLTPLLVETMMPHTASAAGGAISRYLPLRGKDKYGDAELEELRNQLQYAQAGLQGWGKLRLYARTSESETQHSAIDLITALRQYRREKGSMGPGLWRGGLNCLLERTFDFPSFPTYRAVERLNLHKETVVEVLMGEMSTTIQSDDPGFELEAPFQLRVWQLKEWQGASPLDPPIPQFYDFVDSNSVIDWDRALGMRLGKIMLGPQDVLTVTIKDVAWYSFDPEPDELTDHWRQGDSGPERIGFTAVYRGPRSFSLKVRYKTHPSLFARQSMAMLRGYARIWEYPVDQLVKRRWKSVVGILAVLWMLYQCTTAEWCKSLLDKRHTMVQSFLRATLMLLYLMTLLAFANTWAWRWLIRVLHEPVTRYTEGAVTAVLRLFANTPLWGTLVETLSRLFVKADWRDMPTPFAVLMIGGAWLLLRWDTLCFRRGWRLLVIFAASLELDILLSSLYSDSVLNGVKYGSVSGIISSATSLALLPLLVAMFWWNCCTRKKKKQSTEMLFWPCERRPKKRSLQLQHEDLHAFAFAGLASVTFEVTDASLFAIVWLFGVWLAFSLFLDRARPLKFNQPPVNEAKQDAPPSSQNSSSESDKRAETKSAKSDTKTQSQDSSSDDGGLPEGLNRKLDRVRRPAFVFAILVVAIVLSRDPLLRAQLASFTQSASLETAWFMWIFDPFARIATTLIPCIAMVTLVVFLDAALERWRYDRTGKASSSQDIYLKAGLSLLLFPVFLLGIGGLDLFMGTLGLKFSDRIVYYVTVPLLTSIWLDVKAEGLGDLFGKLGKYLKDDLQNKIKLVMGLLSMLIPWLASAPVTEQVDQIIETLQTLQF